MELPAGLGWRPIQGGVVIYGGRERVTLKSRADADLLRKLFEAMDRGEPVARLAASTKTSVRSVSRLLTNLTARGLIVASGTTRKPLTDAELFLSRSNLADPAGPAPSIDALRGVTLRGIAAPGRGEPFERALAPVYVGWANRDEWTATRCQRAGTALLIDAEWQPNSEDRLLMCRAWDAGERLLPVSATTDGHAVIGPVIDRNRTPCPDCCAEAIGQLTANSTQNDLRESASPFQWPWLATVAACVAAGRIFEELLGRSSPTSDNQVAVVTGDPFQIAEARVARQAGCPRCAVIHRPVRPAGQTIYTYEQGTAGITVRGRTSASSERAYKKPRPTGAIASIALEDASTCRRDGTEGLAVALAHTLALTFDAAEPHAAPGATGEPDAPHNLFDGYLLVGDSFPFLNAGGYRYADRTLLRVSAICDVSAFLTDSKDALGARIILVGNYRVLTDVAGTAAYRVTHLRGGAIVEACRRAARIHGLSVQARPLGPRASLSDLLDLNEANECLVVGLDLYRNKSE